MGLTDLKDLLDLEGGVELVEGRRVHHSDVGLDLRGRKVDHAERVRLSPVLVGVLVHVPDVTGDSARELVLEHLGGHVVENLVLDDGELLDVNLHYEGGVEKLAVVLEGLELGNELGVNAANTGRHLLFFSFFSFFFFFF